MTQLILMPAEMPPAFWHTLRAFGVETQNLIGLVIRMETGKPIEVTARYHGLEFDGSSRFRELEPIIKHYRLVEALEPEET